MNVMKRRYCTLLERGHFTLCSGIYPEHAGSPDFVIAETGFPGVHSILHSAVTPNFRPIGQDFLENEHSSRCCRVHAFLPGVLSGRGIPATGFPAGVGRKTGAGAEIRRV